jgi:hypothetical protein
MEKKRKREDEDLPKFSSVKYDVVADKQLQDKRYEREQASYSESNSRPATVSSTFDAFQRMAAGLDSRTISQKLADPNRPTWEQYKKVNEDKLDLVNTDVRQMAEYRAQLDRERDKLLKQRRSESVPILSDSENSDEESTGSEKKKKKKNKKRKKEKKTKKHKKKQKKESKSDSDSSDTE